MFHLNKPLKSQLEKIYPEYTFNKSSEKYLKDSINLFFNLKLSNQEISFSEFCFYFNLNSPNTNDIKNFPISFFNKFKNEFLLFLNPIYFKLNTTLKTLSDDTNLCLNLLYYISKAPSFEKTKFNSNYRSLFTSSELSKYVYINGDLKLSFFKELPFIKLLDIDEVISLRKDFIKKNIPISIIENFKFLENNFHFFVPDIYSFSISDSNNIKNPISNEFEIKACFSNGQEIKLLTFPKSEQYRFFSLQNFYSKKERNLTYYSKIKEEFLSSLS